MGQRLSDDAEPIHSDIDLRGACRVFPCRFADGFQVDSAGHEGERRKAGALRVWRAAGRKRARALFGAVLYGGDIVCDFRCGDNISVSLGDQVRAAWRVWFSDHAGVFGDIADWVCVAVSQGRVGLGVSARAT